MRYSILILFFGVNILAASGQSIQLQFDHTAILVRDMARSVDFYANTLQLEEIDTPSSDAVIRWFDLGNAQQLHLIKVEEKARVKLHKAIHFSLRVADFEALLAYLSERQIPYSDWPGRPQAFSTRTDGVRQVYIQDPDGYWIEINDAPR